VSQELLVPDPKFGWLYELTGYTDDPRRIRPACSSERQASDQSLTVDGTGIFALMPGNTIIRSDDPAYPPNERLRPVLLGRAMSVHTSDCVFIECDGDRCDADKGGPDGEGPFHFTSEHAALEYVLGEQGLGWAGRGCPTAGCCATAAPPTPTARPPATSGARGVTATRTGSPTPEIQIRWCTHCGGGFEVRLTAIGGTL
jgi:hypothetical protein